MASHMNGIRISRESFPQLASLSRRVSLLDLDFFPARFPTHHAPDRANWTPAQSEGGIAALQLKFPAQKVETTLSSLLHSPTRMLS